MKHFLSSAAIVALSFLAVGCSNDDAVVGTTEGQFTTFVGGMSSAPTTRVQLNENGSVSASTLTELTRTSMERTDVGKGSSFFWEKDDEIYVDVNGEYKKSSNKVTGDKVANFKFHVDGNFTESSYNVYYTGKSTESTKVTIASAQTASGYNNTEHFGASGDCGVATATKQDNGAYSFSLDHKAAYLCLLPYANPLERLTYKIKSVKVKSNSNIAGDYTLSDTGLDNSGGSSKEITLTVGTDGNGLMLANKDVATKHIENSLYMVVTPGTHQLTVEITVLDGTTNADVTIKKSFKETALDANKVYDIPVDISSSTSYSKFFKSSGSNTFREANPNDAEFQKLPSVNLITWYIAHGDPRWDSTTEWIGPEGKAYTGGLWIKRIDVIAKEQSKTIDEMNAARTTDYRGTSNSTTEGKPDNISDYFYLPAAGSYWNADDVLSYPGNTGNYWINGPSGTDCACIRFYNGEIYLKENMSNYRHFPITPELFK